MTSVAVGWGYGEWGETPWGGAPPVVPSISLTYAEAIRENVIRLTFSEPVYFSRWHDPNDASFINRYTVTADSTAIGLDGLPSRAVTAVEVELVDGDGLQIDVWLDRAMSPTGSKYTVAVTGLVDKATELLILDPTASSWVVDGVRQGLPVMGIDSPIGNRDFANPQTLSALAGNASESNLGHFVYDDTGDYGIDQGLISYKKRIFRRLTTRKGAFRHLPGYGVSIPQSVKKIARANLVDSLAADAEDQIRQEPETITASVRLMPHPETPGLYIYRINATAAIGDITNFDVPVPV